MDIEEGSIKILCRKCGEYFWWLPPEDVDLYVDFLMNLTCPECESGEITVVENGNGS